MITYFSVDLVCVLYTRSYYVQRTQIVPEMSTTAPVVNPGDLLSCHSIASEAKQSWFILLSIF